MSVNKFTKPTNELTPLANMVECITDGATNLTNRIESLEKQSSDLNTQVSTNTQKVSTMQRDILRKINQVCLNNTEDGDYAIWTKYDKGDVVDWVKTRMVNNQKIDRFYIEGIIENVPCYKNGAETTKTVTYKTTFICVGVDFVKPSDEAKRTYTFLATGSPIGENIIDPATSLNDVPAYSKTFLQTKVMPVYEEHFKNIFKYHVATLSEPLPYEIDTSIQSFASTRQGGRSKENYGNNPVTFSMRLPSEIELFGHRIISGVFDNTGMDVQFPYFALNSPHYSLYMNKDSAENKGIYLSSDMWLASYDYNNYYSCYTLPEFSGRGKGKVVTSRPCNVEFGIYPLITLTSQ